MCQALGSIPSRKGREGERRGEEEEIAFKRIETKSIQ
jgi:hypothetical protein